MARPKPWLGNICRIINAVEALPESSFSRADIEQLFGIGRSAAAELMRVIGTRPLPDDAGRALVTAESVLFYLRNSPDAENAMAEQARRKKLAEKLSVASEEAKLRSIRIPITSLDQWCTLAQLPNVAIEEGVLRVAFASADELMADLYRLVMAAGADWDAFERLCSKAEKEGKKAS